MFARELTRIKAWGAIVRMLPAMAAGRQTAVASDLVTALIATGSHLPHEAVQPANAINPHTETVATC